MLLCSQFRNYKRKKAGLWNFSCPICNDSSSVKNKARGYIYHHKGQLKYKCHNCQAHQRFDTFLKQQNPYLYSDFLKEKYVEKEEAKPVVEEWVDPTEHVDLKIFSNLKSFSELSPTHPARKYLEARKVPGQHFKHIFYAPFYKKFVNSVVPDKFDKESLTRDEPRMVFPFISENHEVVAFTGRSFNPEAVLRYMTVTVDSSQPKVFGADRYDKTKKHYVVEGPIDSLFLPNAIAVGGSNLIYQLNENSVAIFDNQPRNKEICKLMEKTIEADYNVCVWPNNMVGKDINDLILDGMTSEEIVQLIDSNTHKGLMALQLFNEWKK